MFALVFILVWIKLVDIFAVVTLAELGIAVKALLEADTVVLLAPVALAVAALAHEESVLNLLELIKSPHFGCLRVIVFAVSAGARRGVTLGRPLQTHTVLLCASSVLTRAWLHVVSYHRRHRSWS